MRHVRFAVAGAILAYSIVSYEPGARTWAIGSVLLFGVVLALQFTPMKLARAYALWFAAFLVTQALLTPWLRSDFRTLPPRMHSTLDVHTDEIPGVVPGLRHITTDERGFRVNPRIDYASKKGLRIFAIGGSTTENIMLDDEATWSHLLQEKLKARVGAAEVINTGVSGLRTRHHLATLDVVSRLDPDIVIFLLGANDWNQQIRARFNEHSWKPVSLRYSVLGTIADSAIISPLRREVTGRGWADINRQIHSLGDFAHSKNRSADRTVIHSFLPDRVSSDYAEALSDISRVCKREQLVCIFMTQPHAYRASTPDSLRARFWMTPPDAPYSIDLESMQRIAVLYNDFLKDFANREKHISCDTANGIDASPRNFFDDLHFTNEGARLLADLAFSCVLRAIDVRGNPHLINVQSRDARQDREDPLPI